MAPPASIGRLTTNEVAAKLGVSRRRVLALVAAGRLPAERVGNQFLILPADLAAVKERKPGRPSAPSKAKAAKGRKRK